MMDKSNLMENWFCNFPGTELSVAYITKVLAFQLESSACIYLQALAWSAIWSRLSLLCFDSFILLSSSWYMGSKSLSIFSLRCFAFFALYSFSPSLRLSSSSWNFVFHWMIMSSSAATFLPSVSSDWDLSPFCQDWRTTDSDSCFLEGRVWKK